MLPNEYPDPITGEPIVHQPGSIGELRSREAWIRGDIKLLRKKLTKRLKQLKELRGEIQQLKAKGTSR